MSVQILNCTHFLWRDAPDTKAAGISPSVDNCVMMMTVTIFVVVVFSRNCIKSRDPYCVWNNLTQLCESTFQNDISAQGPGTFTVQRQ